MVGKINDNAMDTWLEPYIGWEVKIIKTSKSFVWFKWDVGADKLVTKKYEK